MFNPNRRTFMAFALASLLTLGGLTQATPQQQASAVNFRLRTTEGGEITSEMLRGEVVVLAFGASWLPSLSRTQIQGVQKLADEYAEQNLRVYWVSTDSESPKSRNYATDNQLRDFAKKYGLKVAVLRDPDGKLLKELRIDQQPAVVILDRQGGVSQPIIGGLDPGGNLADQLAPRLNRMLNRAQ